jgi:UDP-N-acetylmuramoyl-L-alanyl-D-glutamate--2,6-diaminopimelate ligase
MLQELMKTVRVKRVLGPLKAAKVRGVTQDSRKVEKGFLFVAISGGKLDGHDFVTDAVARGAIAAVVRRNAHPEGKVPQFVVTDPRAALADLAARFYGEPSLKMRVAGVTGTNGKTSVTYLLESILKAAGRKPAVLGTVNYRFGGREWPAPHTTPESVDLQELFAKMLEEGVSDVVMEVSSHALSMERVRGVHFDVAAFTNLTQDHLDYHADLDEYFEAKKALFTRFLAASLKTRRSAVINLDDPRGSKITRGLAKSVERATVSVEGPADVFCRSHRLSEEGLTAEVVSGDGVLRIRSPLIGDHNLQNILVAIGLAKGLGVGGAEIEKGIANLERVPGRLERIPNGRGLNVFVDYAHTPDALGRVAAALKAFAETKGARLITVFGCGGDRDRAKRPLMGREAGRFSDIVIVTSDNPRTEDPEAILDEIMPGLSDARLPADRIHRITDREKALREAVKTAKPGDFVLVAGKGHEDYQVLGTKKVHFSDQEILRRLVA